MVEVAKERRICYSMGMIRLILGRAGTGKTARIFAEIASLVQKERGSVVLLVPEQYSHEAERELCRAAGDRLSLYGEVLSFTGLARRVQSRFGGGARPVMDRGGRLLCMAWALDRLPPESLPLYRRARKDARAADVLVRGMEELRSAGADAEALLTAAGAEDVPTPLAEKLRELALIGEAYAAALGRSAADPAETLDTLAERVASDPAVRAWAAGTTFFIDGFSDFTALEQRVLAAILRAGADMTFCLTCGEGDVENSVFSLTAGTVRRLREAAAEAGIPCVSEQMEPEGDPTPIRYLAEHLFDFTPGDAPENDGSVSLVTAADPYEECELAAAKMSELARAGARWRDMAVAIRGFGDYRAALESACARYNVPLFLAGRGDTLQKSLPLLVVSALEAVTRGYEYEAVFGYLKTGLSPLTPAETDRLENYALLWELRGSMWHRPFTMHPEGYNRDMNADAKARLSDLNTLRDRAIAPLASLEAAMKAAFDARSQAQALADFFGNIALAERLAERSAELNAAGRREAAAEYDQLWEVLCTALEQFAAVLGDTPMDAGQFRELFTRMLSKYDVGIIPVSLDRVQAGDFDGMRRRELRHLFILGASDGRLPAPEESAGVFTPEEREELTDLGLPLGGPEEDLAREFWRIYSCLSLPSDTLCISRPLSMGADGETRPSLVMERAAALLGIPAVPGDLRHARTFSREAAYTLAVRAEAGDAAPECLAAREFFLREGHGDELSALVRRARAGRGQLGPEAVRRLYGDRPAVTATRAEKFGDCRFAYFLQYGLRAKPRQKAVFDARDNGTFLHWVLEQVAREVSSPEMGGFAKATEADIDRLTDKYVDEYIRTELNDFSEKTARFEYLFRRLRGTVRHVTRELWREMRVSKFRPIEFELDLSEKDILSASDEDLRLYGFVDRVDAWEHNDRLYLRVVDYKTGVKDFRLSDIVEGVNMQMLLYLFALADRGSVHFGGKEIVPAGVLYSPARFRVVRADAEPSDDDLALLRENDMTGASGVRRGLILRDEEVIEAMEPGPEKHFLPIKYSARTGELLANEGQLASLEQFGSLSRYIRKTLQDMAAELRAGSVAADPWFRSTTENACLRCEFADACQFDESSDAWRVRESLRPAEAWKTIEETVGESHE